MPIDTAAVITELREVLAEAEQALQQSSSIGASSSRGPDMPSVAIALCRSAIERYTPEDSPYRRQVALLTKQPIPSLAIARDMTGTLTAFISDFEKGRLRSFEETLHADVSGDYLDQAESLLRGGFKDAAMVIAGSVLEQHLRLIAERHGVSVFSGGRHKKAEQLNADLCKAGVYGRTEQKTVTAWLGRRNEAAHGDYEAYDHREVKHVMDGIQAFIARFPA